MPWDVGFYAPNASDNSGAVANFMTSPADFTSLWMIDDDLSVTYTAEDHAGNTATCTVDFHIIGNFSEFEIALIL